MPKITIEISDYLKSKIQQNASLSLRSFAKQVVFQLNTANGVQLQASDVPIRQANQIVIPPRATNIGGVKLCRTCSERIPEQEYNDFGGYCEQHGKKTA